MADEDSAFPRNLLLMSSGGASASTSGNFHLNKAIHSTFNPTPTPPTPIPLDDTTSV